LSTLSLTRAGARSEKHSTLQVRLSKRRATAMSSDEARLFACYAVQ
jgi:hypothetical protein